MLKYERKLGDLNHKVFTNHYNNLPHDFNIGVKKVIRAQTVIELMKNYAEET